MLGAKEGLAALLQPCIDVCQGLGRVAGTEAGVVLKAVGCVLGQVGGSGVERKIYGKALPEPPVVSGVLPQLLQLKRRPRGQSFDTAGNGDGVVGRPKWVHEAIHLERL